MSDYISKALNAKDNNMLEAMHTSFPALVVSYNEKAHTATLQPIYKYGDGSNYPQIQNAPVSKFRYKAIRQKGYPSKTRQTENEDSHTHAYSWTSVGGSGNTSSTSHLHNIEYEEYVEEIKLLLRPGDIVLCVCSEKSIDAMVNKSIHVPQSKRAFDISDAVVICLL